MQLARQGRAGQGRAGGEEDVAAPLPLTSGSKSSCPSMLGSMVWIHSCHSGYSPLLMLSYRS